MPFNVNVCSVNYQFSHRLDMQHSDGSITHLPNDRASVVKCREKGRCDSIVDFDDVIVPLGDVCQECAQTIHR